MLNIEYNTYPDFLVSVRRLVFCVVPFIDEGLLFHHLLEIEFHSVLELGVSIPIISTYCLIKDSWNL
jgi:hypothetical protein